MLHTAVNHDGPVAIRYPRGNGYGVAIDQTFRSLPIGRGELLRDGADAAILAVGTMVYPALEAAELLAGEGLNLAVANMRFIKPLDRELILALADKTGRLVTVEENVLQGGFGSAVLELLEEAGRSDVAVTRIGFPDAFVEQGEQWELRARYGLDAAGIAARIRETV
jgi:1-deoxy-D-xylulose-5-phosphate synthase